MSDIESYLGIVFTLFYQSLNNRDYVGLLVAKSFLQPRKEKLSNPVINKIVAGSQ